MSYRYQRRYTGQVQGVILDWAGTTLDYGCFAPTMVFVEGFAAEGVTISLEEARQPMGKFKRDHIAAIMAMPDVQARWRSVHGALPSDADVQRLFEAFIPRQMAVLADYATLIPDVVPAIHALRERGLKIGSCTGYTEAMMAVVAPLAAAQGYAPDALITPDMVGGRGRPAPWMAFRNAEQMNVYPMMSLVKIGDTLSDIEEGLNAGMWTIGITQTGNELGMSFDQVQALPPAELANRLALLEARFYQAGAHYVIRTLAELLPRLDEIAWRLGRGEQP